MNLTTPKWLKVGCVALLIWLPFSCKRANGKSRFPKYAGNAAGWGASRWRWRIYIDYGFRGVPNSYQPAIGIITPA